MMRLPMLSLLFLALQSLAQVPQPLLQLIPTGSKSIRMEGQTVNGQKCQVDISRSALAYTVSVYGLTNSGGLDSRRFSKFQIGLGHKLTTLDNQQNSMTAVSELEPEEQYSRKQRATLYVSRRINKIDSVQVTNEYKGIFRYSVGSDMTCLFRN